MVDLAANADTKGRLADVKAALVETLGLESLADALDAATPLTSMPQLDSMAIIELVLELERRFGITVDDEDVTPEVFDTLGSLTEFVGTKTR